MEAQEKQRKIVENTQTQAAEEKKVLQKQSSVVNQDKIAVQKELQERILESAMDYAIIAMDRGGRVTRWNAGLVSTPCAPTPTRTTCPMRRK